MSRAQFRFLVLVLLLLIAAVAVRPARGRGDAPSLVGPAVITLELTPVSITANDIVYDPVRQRLYASLSGDQGALGNSIVSITPDGQVRDLGFIGSEPNVLALSDDAAYLYVGLDGAAAVRRLNLTTLVAEPQWPLASQGLNKVIDMVVLDAAADVIAVAEGRDHFRPWVNVRIYEEGVGRPTITPEGTQHDRLEASDNPQVLYSLNTFTSARELNRLAVTDDGVTIAQSVSERFFGVSPFDLRYAAGRLYGSDGRLVDAATLAPLGRFAAEGPVAPRPEMGRVFFLHYDGAYLLTELRLFDVATFRQVAAARVPNFGGTYPNTPVELLPAGPNRLAFRTATGQVYWLHYHLMDDLSFVPFLGRAPWAAGQ
jgi:hypothetical protein